ncbi:MAG: endonuclease [Armatimonadota bacterium]|nr:endonuclease [Armatimonadota bacterium]
MSRYDGMIEHIFRSKLEPQATVIDFTREELEKTAEQLNIKLPKNLGDIIYSYRYRKSLPKAMLDTQPEGMEWVIRPAGSGKYRFALLREFRVVPNEQLEKIKIPDATPGIIGMYAQSDEQALLAKLRYNRLLDVFLGAACYSLQSHLRTSVPEVGQIEVDELYIAVRKAGAHYIVPVQAKGGSDKIGRIQIEQDMAYAQLKYGHLQCRPIGAQFIDDFTIALFEFARGPDDLVIRNERHYRLVAPDEMSEDDLRGYALGDDGVG